MARRSKELKKLKIPYYPGDGEDKGSHYEVNTREEKVISEYTGFSFDRIEKLDVFEYWLYLRDAVIYNYSTTEEGQKYLDNCYRLEQTKPDREALRKKFKGGDLNGQ